MKNTIIRASAGSGKTYQLSNRFLQQIFDASSVESTLDSILASTFTRKAAGEITDRIFTKFADIVLDPKKREMLRKDIRYPKTKNEIEELQKRLAELAKNMYRMRVGTLDSYFNRIASAFSLELGLPFGWSILGDSDYERLLTEAVRNVFEESDRNGAKDLMHLLQKGRDEASIIPELVELASKMLPLVRTTSDKAWEHNLSEMMQELPPVKIGSEEIQGFVETLKEMDENQMPKTKGDPNKPVADFVNLHNNLIRILENGSWDEFLKLPLTGVVVTTLKDKNAPCTITRSRIDVRQAAKRHYEIVRKLIPYAATIQFQHLIEQTAATRDLLKLIARQLDVLMVRERGFRYEDVTRKVAEYRFGQERLQSLNHRLNGHTKHLLLDEFQDTAIPQWSVLQPLAEQVAQDEHGTFFCVGDVKQSIYFWRGGVAAIFDTMHKSLENAGAHVEEQSMDTTRRNRPPIVETVNLLFQEIQKNAAVVEASSQAGLEWERRFKKHDPYAKDAGYCTLEESPLASKEETKDEAHLNYVVERIMELAETIENRPQLKKGVGVLVSTKTAGAEIVSELKRRGVVVNGAGGTLAQSAAVRYVLSAVTLADHPGDTIAKFHLATGPLKDVLGITGDVYQEKDGDPECSQRIRYDLATLGYGETIRKYVQALAPSCDPHEFSRLEKLLELAYRFDEESTGIRTLPFTELVQQTDVTNPDAANITVSTIHKAKGLEYDVVVLPQLDHDMAGKKHTPKFIVDHAMPDDKTSPIDFVLRYCNESVQNILPKRYKEVFLRRIQGEVEESLAELYVAMTRAIHQLVMIVHSNEEKTKKKTVGTTFEDALRCGLPRNADSDSDNILYEEGDESWFETFEIDNTVTPVPEIRELSCVISDREVFHHVGRIVPSKQHKTNVTENESTAETSVSPKVRGKGPVWGTAIHACFEHGVLWLDDTGKNDAGIDDEMLHEIVADAIQGKAASFTTENVVAGFRKMCENPEVIKVLSRKRYASPNVRVERERRFSVWIGNEIMHGSIDRLVVGRDAAGKIVEIEILDYKSDANDEVESLFASYREQLETYRKGVAALFHVDPGKIKATLVFVTLGVVKSL